MNQGFETGGDTGVMDEIPAIPQTPYEALGVSDGVTDDEIKDKYRELAGVYHPDQNPGNAKAAEYFSALSEARDILLYPNRNAGRHSFFKEYNKPPQPKPEPKTEPAPPPPKPPKPKPEPEAQKPPHTETANPFEHSRFDESTFGNFDDMEIPTQEELDERLRKAREKFGNIFGDSGKSKKKEKPEEQKNKAETKTGESIPEMIKDAVKQAENGEFFFKIFVDGLVWKKIPEAHQLIHHPEVQRCILNKAKSLMEKGPFWYNM